MKTLSVFIAPPKLHIAICSDGNCIPLWRIIEVEFADWFQFRLYSGFIKDVHWYIDLPLEASSFYSKSMFLLLFISVGMPHVCVFSHARVVNTFAIIVDATCFRFYIKLFSGHCSMAKFWSSGRSIKLAQIDYEFRTHVPALGAYDTLVPLCGQSVHKQVYSSE